MRANKFHTKCLCPLNIIQMLYLIEKPHERQFDYPHYYCQYYSICKKICTFAINPFNLILFIARVDRVNSTEKGRESWIIQSNCVKVKNYYCKLLLIFNWIFHLLQLEL